MFMPLRPMHLPNLGEEEEETEANHQIKPDKDEHETFRVIQPWDRVSVQISVSETFFQRLLDGGELICKNEIGDTKVSQNQKKFKKLVTFASNDFLGLSRHPTIAKATAKACLLCPTGFSANMSTMVAIGSLAPLFCAGKRPTKEEKIAIFSDALNHASIIDGLKLAEQYGWVECFVYKHCDVSHLDELLTNCKMKKKVLVIDSLFSMDGDFAPIVELAELRKKHGFLFVIDDAHATFVWGKNGGVAEEFNCEDDIDICVGTLSKGAASLGGFIACSKNWKQFIQSRGRSFIFSSAAPVPLAAASYASVVVARKEAWRRMEIRKRMQEFQALSGIPITSQILCVTVGSIEKTIKASQALLENGIYVVSILGPPIVPPNTGRLRVTLTAVHTTEDIEKLVTILSDYINFPVTKSHSPTCQPLENL
ncbi:hypothetical protein DITRI_Ditri01bG0175700 [Diplodiscus trichospermus]